MKRVLIAILLATACQSASEDYKVYDLDKLGETARIDDKGKCMDMDGNLLPDKAELKKWHTKYNTFLGRDYNNMIKTYCVDGEAIEERGYYESGGLDYTVPIKNGKYEGVKKHFGGSDKLITTTPYKNGVVDGIKKGYYESGKLYFERPYKNDVKDGIEKTYYENGRLGMEIPYKNDVKDGIEKTYYENGNLKQETAWKNDILEGEMKVFRENGTISTLVTYKNDKVISGVCYKTNGKKVPFTEAELENSRNRLNATCD
ncbi:MAG: toxin-antitoxin system YwqK family antitoxin [Helicobacteraceae bacterium]|nr:toxin-antitoxin system YwqK family antitoxin [Helicobacteraceae bacterium]